MSHAVVTTTLYLDGSYESQRTEIMALEKGDNTIVRHVDRFPKELQALNPTNVLPVLLDKHLILYGSNLIDAFFEERFPAPPLLPSTPVSRAKIRFLAEQVKSWYDLAATDPRQLHENLDEFADQLDPNASWFAGDFFTLVDIAVAPLLQDAHALAYTILPRSPLGFYRDRLLSRPSIHAAEQQRRTRLLTSDHHWETVRALH